MILQMTEGVAWLSSLRFGDTSESRLSGRSPPFRLLFRALNASTRELLAYGVSESFVVRECYGEWGGGGGPLCQHLMVLSSEGSPWQYKLWSNVLA